MTQYATSPGVYWIYPCDQPAPTAQKINLLTKGGIEVSGTWRDGGDFIAWQYLFRRDKEKEKGYEY